MIAIRCPSCRRAINSSPDTTGLTICVCGHRIEHATAGDLATLTVADNRRPLLPSEWPAWALRFKRWARPGEIGVGDTARRVFAWLGGELYKQTAMTLGMPCGCSDRQDEWNRLYPYDVS